MVMRANIGNWIHKAQAIACHRMVKTQNYSNFQNNNIFLLKQKQIAGHANRQK